MTNNVLTLAPVTQAQPAGAEQPKSAQKFAESLLFETFLRSAEIGKALAPPSLEGGMFGDFLIQQLAQQLASQVSMPLSATYGE